MSGSDTARRSVHGQFSAFARGAPLLTISRQLGHASPAITAKVYAHLHLDSLLDAFRGRDGCRKLRDGLREPDAEKEAA
jgi:hypothetical protein